jgi:hypothetical protein
LSFLSFSDYRDKETALASDLARVFGSVSPAQIRLKSDHCVLTIANELNRVVEIIVNFKDTKLKEYETLDVLSRTGVTNIQHERDTRYVVPRQ